MSRLRPLPDAIAALQGDRKDAAFARALGVPRNYPARWKAGVKPSTDHLLKLVDAGLNPAYLPGYSRGRQAAKKGGAAA